MPTVDVRMDLRPTTSVVGPHTTVATKPSTIREAEGVETTAQSTRRPVGHKSPHSFPTTLSRLQHNLGSWDTVEGGASVDVLRVVVAMVVPPTQRRQQQYIEQYKYRVQ
uniref:C2 domain-containing protein 2 n=1 Tax=Lygus hesperus TaxID=30085 RepID=A0A0A9XHX9_LYGHE